MLTPKDESLLIEGLVLTIAKCHTTLTGGCLGSHNDEERSEMRYVM